ncbi:hypothetical protein [Puniceibacterium confluentis]
MKTAFTPIASSTGGAVIVAFLGYRLVLQRDRPFYGPMCDIPIN